MSTPSVQFSQAVNVSTDFPVVFSDLDGTLLDHDTYSFAPALPMLKWLKQAGVPVIPVTSKTRAEVLSLRAELELDTPFVVENGAAIYLPESSLDAASAAAKHLAFDHGFWVKALAPPRAQWTRWLSQVAEQLPNAFTCFSWLGDTGVAEATGLSLEQARLANDRQFSEPLMWTGDAATLTRFKRLAEHAGYDVIEGGRFVHVTSGYDKGVALTWLRDYYATQSSRAVTSIALGDSGNDIDMLETADIAFLIKSPVKDFPSPVRAEQLHYSSAFGPAGWHECLAALFGQTTAPANTME